MEQRILQDTAENNKAIEQLVKVDSWMWLEKERENTMMEKHLVFKEKKAKKES